MRSGTRTTDCTVCEAKAGERCLNTVTGLPGSFVHGGRATRWLRERGWPAG